MSASISRRQFVATTASAVGLADFAFLHALPSLAADDVRPKIVPLNPDIEPLVRFIEDTAREDMLPALADRIRHGTSYGDLLAAVMLAGVRGIQPRPVGFKFHAVLVINSAHQASLAATDRDRWLPLFWAIDNFKNSQARNKAEGDWRMPPVNDGKLPPAHQARQRFTEAMDSWDVEGADAAVAAFVRSCGATEVIETFWRYGARDFRDIGHKAIYVANATRTLQTIGWRHAEPVLRSLAYALLEHEGTNPAKRDGDPDRPFRDNMKQAAQIRKDWHQGKIDRQPAIDMLEVLRTGKPTDTSETVVKLLNKQFDPACVWDGIFLGAGELLIRQPGIVGLHTLTTVNALHHACQNSGNDETRRLMLLQAAAFLPMFREAMKSRGKVGDDRIDALEKVALEKDGKTDGLTEVFNDVGGDRLTAARKTLAYLDGGSAQALLAEARRLIFAKGTDSHDYKFSSATLEDYYHVTPAWRNRFLAASTYWLRGSSAKDNELIKRTREALAKT